jgi:hypothetical protein
MLDRRDIKPAGGENDADRKVVLNTSFSCSSCASGAEKYSELFHQGTCVNCGAPLEQFYATLTEKGEQELKASVILLYSGEDAVETARNVTTELERDGIKVIDVHDIIDGSKTSVVAANLAYVMDKAALSLVVPSQHLETDPIIATCVGEAVFRSIERSKKIIPVYTRENISMGAPFGLTDITGIDWDGNAGDARVAVEKTRALVHLHRFVAENTLK